MRNDYNLYKPLLNLGKITSSNNFFKNKKKNIPLRLSYNLYDGSIKLIDNIAYNKLKPSHKIKQNEPEFHLKDIAKIIFKILNKKSLAPKNIFGLSYKDKPLIDLVLKKKKLKKYNSNFFFKDIKKNTGTLELLNRFSEKLNIIKKPEKFDIIIMRHIWEHIFNHKSFLNNFLEFTDDKTIFYFEIPDSKKMIKKLDYSMIWEEHNHYYTKESFLNSLRFHNFRVIKIKKYKQKYEDILSVIAIKNNKNNKINIKKNNQLLNLTIEYGKKFPIIKKEIQEKFKEISFNNKIFTYGASHMLNVFINIFNLEKYISFIIDDNLKKQNNYMFINKLKIYDFRYLENNKADYCLLGVNAESNKNLKKKIKFIKQKNIKVFSIFK
jgi:hypothetical protein